MEQFDDIRPYRDQEVGPILDRLLKDKELLSALIHFSYPSLASVLGGLLRPLTRFILQRKLAGVSDVRALQHIIAPYIRWVITHSTSDVTWSGLDNLKQGKACLFLSNHRDIVMDSAFVNYGLYENDLETMRVAIGDNLIERPYVRDLMRLNKSFIVRRSLASPREKLAAYRKLSAFINNSIETGHSVWIAHREGRAKDGNDRTESAIIKMLYMSQKGKSCSFGEVVARLNIIPVAVSYEYDPCDLRKADELQIRAQHGRYDKREDEDLQSIAAGIKGWKGRVHVAFGEPLGAEYESAIEVAQAIDRQIHANYHLHPSNYIAHALLARQQGREAIPNWESRFGDVNLKENQRIFHERLETCRSESRPWLLEMYANPVVNQYTKEPL